MKFAPMNYHYLRYPIKKFLDKVERSPFDSIDLYCSAPQLNLFDYPLSRLIDLKKDIKEHHLKVMTMTPEIVYTQLIFVHRMILQESPVFVTISGQSIQHSFWNVQVFRLVQDLDILIILERKRGNIVKSLL